MNIVLLGYMGSGKSTVGKHLAEELSMEFIDLDSFIETSLKESISSIFKRKGEIYFRKKETELLQKALSEHNNMVLSVGGGTPCYGSNMDVLLAATPNVFYLKCSIPTLSKRLIQGKERRPLIAHLKNEEIPEFIGKHLFERSPFYAKAHKTIICDEKSTDEIGKEIKAYLV